jgi:tRNA pseudouridine55 synthase
LGNKRRGNTTLSGLLAVDKPAGLTSHDVVDRIRRTSGEGRVGHAGTLDPAATGLLLVCVGPATRLSDYLMHRDKAYEARICFGVATDTDDAEGAPIAQAPIPSKVADADFACDILSRFTGSFLQLPPRYAAIKRDGVAAYKLARAGKEPELEPREVTIHSIQLLETTADSWRIELVCSKGAYVRALARDLGEGIGSHAHLAALRRTRIGTISIKDAPNEAVTLEELETEGVEPYWLDPFDALGYPALALTAAEYRDVTHGRTLVGRADGLAEGAPVSLVYDRRLVAVFEARAQGRVLIPRTIIPGGISGRPVD